jgi:predicted metal-dependent HD superfamily phosphohydrolase
MTRPLERITDDDLHGRLNAIRAMIRRTRKHGGDTQDAEVELCYLERELEVRTNRKIAHEEYKQQLAQEEAARKEEEEALRDYLESGDQAIL